MALRVTVLASGSTGNSVLYEARETRVLVDCGLSARRVAHLLSTRGVSPDELDAVLVTHEHTDHVKGLRVFLKKRKIPLFIAPESLETANLREVDPWHVEPLSGGVPVVIGSLTVTPFAVPHDAAMCLGFVLEAGGIRAVQATDLGSATTLVRERMKGAHCLLLEFNHDVDRLMEGPYPLDVKMRVRGRLGHLANEQAAELLGGAANGSTRMVYLMHLSQQNNLPELATLAARESLSGRETKTVVALPHEASPPWEG